MNDFLHLLKRERIVLTSITSGAKKIVHSAQFTDPERAMAWAKEQNAWANVYYTVNSARDVSDKLANGKRPSAEDIEHIFAFKMDIDSVRPKDTSATQAEKDATTQHVLAPLYAFLKANLAEPMVVDSGNGYNVLVRLEPVAEPTKEFQRACETFMDFLAAKFDVSDIALLDTSVKDLPRVLALPGTMKRKGESTDERPHREVSLVGAGEPVSLKRFTALAAEIADLWGDRKIQRWVEKLPAFSEFHNSKLSFVGWLKKHAMLDEETVTRVTDLYTWLRGEPDWDMVVEKADNRRMVIDTFAKDDENISTEHLTIDQKKLLGDVFMKDKKERILEEMKVPEVAPTVEVVPPAPVQAIKMVTEAHVQVNVSKAELTDVGNANRFVDENRGSIFYIVETGKWVVWDGARWNTDYSGALVQSLAVKSVNTFIKEVAESLVMMNREESLKWGVASLNVTRVSAVPTLSRGFMATSSRVFDRDPFLLNTLSGTVDLHTGECRPHRSEDMLTAMAPVKFDPDAKCPRWLSFLQEILPDIPLDYIQKWYGYSLTGDTRERKFQIRQGVEGKNGKTTEKNTVLHVLGDYAIEIPIATFIGKKRDYKGDDLVALRNKRLVFASEPDDSVILNVAMLKQVVGRDTIRCRPLHSNTWLEFEATFKIAIITNPEPSVYNSGSPFWDRVMLIPYNIIFPEEKQDKTLEDKLKAEAPGILAWMVRGCLLWQREGLQAPARVKQATNDYRMEQDTFGRFLEEFRSTYPKNEDGWIQSAKLYGIYALWCDREGVERLHDKKFAGQLKARGMSKDRRNTGIFWHVTV